MAIIEAKLFVDHPFTNTFNTHFTSFHVLFSFILAIVAGLAGGVLSYAKKAVASIVAFANPEDVKLEIKPDADNWNKGSIETITGEFTTKELEEASENE